ncbi:hypothetical protein [Kitasatospora sp. NPDC088783]|uniref:hypothetical protein n=1 Tax=Kitasatospora sp. NPDC088783 TaxID=3364077 RepID=UPI00382C0500
MVSTPPRTTEDRSAAPAAVPERTAGAPAAGAAAAGAPAAAPVPMRALLAACRAAEAVSTPPERRAA